MINAEHPQFITITVYEWKHLLKPDKYKRLVIDSLSFLVENRRVHVYGFVIMSNHMHLIWQIQEPHQRKDVQRDFLKFLGQQIKFDLAENHPDVLKRFLVNRKDRKYQFWQRNSYSLDLFSETVFLQKLAYTHENPVKAGLCDLPEEYHYSSARFYELNESSFGFLTHHTGN